MYFCSPANLKEWTLSVTPLLHISVQELLLTSIFQFIPVFSTVENKNWVTCVYPPSKYQEPD